MLVCDYTSDVLRQPFYSVKAVFSQTGNVPNAEQLIPASLLSVYREIEAEVYCLFPNDFKPRRLRIVISPDSSVDLVIPAGVILAPIPEDSFIIGEEINSFKRLTYGI